MLRRLRKLRLSLAAKCQLLFGAAGLLIIAAALVVPFQRMEQLTGQLDESAARAVAQSALTRHALSPAPADVAPASRPAGEPPDPPDPLAVANAPIARPPADEALSDPAADARAPTFADSRYPAPRLLLLGDATAPGAADRYDAFERGAAARFAADPGRPSFARYTRAGDGPIRFRYAEPARLAGDCLRCHAAPAVATIDAGGLDGQAPPYGLVAVDIPSQIAGRQLLLNRVFLITAGLFAGTVAVLVLYLILSRLILGPVQVLQDAAERVAAGDLDVRADIPSGDEFEQFARTFNAMLAGLKTGRDSLQQANKLLDQKLDQLAETNVALNESNRLKSEFLASVSHELRTPLNSILGFAQLLQEGDGSPRSTRYAGNIATSGQALLDLINDLLDLAKIEAGRMEVRSEPLSLPDLFEALVGVLKPLCAARPVSIRPDVGPGIPVLRTDPTKLQQILYNLLSNAIKFSPPGGSIVLGAAMEPPPAPDGDGDPTPRVRLSVSDQGPGIPPEQQELIFEKFRQADSSVTRAHGGTGLGLAISRELAALLGGSVGVDSEPGRGATFWCVLPVEIEAESKTVSRRPAATRG